MAKNIVVYSDGTGQDGGVRPEQRVSNVYKLYRASRVSFDTAIDPREQVAFYDPGLGTDSSHRVRAFCLRSYSPQSRAAGSRGISLTATSSSSITTSPVTEFF
jgi:uncharacterized protein (DUF2235 family)